MRFEQFFMVPCGDVDIFRKDPMSIVSACTVKCLLSSFPAAAFWLLPQISLLQIPGQAWPVLLIFFTFLETNHYFIAGKVTAIVGKVITKK